MKSLQIALLLVAGAIAGAMVMKMMPKSRPPVERVETPRQVEVPPAVVAQVEKPSPVGGEPAAQPPPADSPQTAETKPETVPAAASPASVPAHPAVPRERPVRRPVYTPPSRYIDPAPPVYVTVAPNPPFQRPLPLSSPAPRRPAAGSPQTYPEEITVPAKPAPPAPFPAPLPEARQERPAPPATPPVRTVPEHVTPVPPLPPEPHRVTLNAGTIIPVRLIDGLSTERNKPGDRFTATLVNELIAGEFVIAERGARVEGQVVACDPGGGVLTAVLTRLHLSDGQDVAIRTDGFERRADRRMPTILPADTRIPFRLGVSVTLTERTQ